MTRASARHILVPSQEDCKVLSIFMVMIGHFFKEYELLWVPVTVGLLIFSFSSGYFTAVKYRGRYSIKKFWKRKFERLGINLLVVNSALLCLFVFQGRAGIVTWHSVINIIGLNGLFSWSKIPNLSPFGAGMWFFTLLLIFYACYPLIEKMNAGLLLHFSVLFTVGAFYLSRHVYLGHSLWMTACGFMIGVYAGKGHLKVSSNLCAFLAMIILSVMLYANFVLSFKELNFFFILFFSLTLIGAVTELRLPQTVNTISFFFTGCLLEIYLVHWYFFMTPTSHRLLNFLISFFIIVLISKFLSSVSTKLNNKLIKADRT